MTTQVSEELTKEEAERRQEVIAAVEKVRPGTGRGFLQIIPQHEQLIIQKLLEEKIFPFVSSAHLNWRVDHLIWQYGEKDADFPFPRPRLYGVPYSAAYAKAYFAANPTDKDRDEAEAETLHQKIDRFAYQLGVAKINRRIKGKADIKEKIDELVNLNHDPKDLYPIAEDPVVRLAMIKPTAEKVLTEQVRLVLDPSLDLELSKRLEQCVSFLQDRTCPWETLLPPDVRYRIISAAIWDYQKDHGQKEGFDLVRRTLEILGAYNTARCLEDNNLV
ncbi:hypothetical protein F4823DRAFT_637034 [Ustulina deusta]|nr:hypothetical protein F4823DRAFT_637034 [Ustulina deusta]